MSAKNREARRRAELAQKQSRRESQMRNPSGKSAYAKKQRTRPVNTNWPSAPEDETSITWNSPLTRAEQYQTPERPMVQRTVMPSGKTIRSVWMDGKLKFV